MARAHQALRCSSLFRVARAALPALLASALSACGPNGAAPKECGTGQVICGTVCVDLSNDTDNCGLCGNACEAPKNGGATACVRGVCAPTCSGGGLALCDAAPGADGGLVLSCTDTNLDPNNCGACGNACGPNQNCDDGVCTGCPSGMLRCPGGAGMPPICLAILSDNENCGGCGTACSSGTYCDNGACVATGDSNCGNADGGATSSANLQTDRYNCGVCGNVCADAETCTNGRCEPCPVAQCGNLCTDTASDPANCGGCAIACPGAQVCVEGACGAGVQVEMLGPADGGYVFPYNTAFQYVQVESELPITTVYIDGPTFGALADGGPITRQAANLESGPQNLGSYVSSWEINIPPQAADGGWNGVITATAYDQAWSTAGTNAPAHMGTASATLRYAGAIDGGYVPSLTVTSGSTQLASGAYVPLGAPAVVLSASVPAPSANVGSVQFFMEGLSGQGLVLGTGQSSGGSLVLQALPSQMLLGTSNIYAVAYAQDGTTYENESPAFSITVGSVETAAGSNPALTVDDAGTANLWWFADNDGTGAMVNTRFNQAIATGLPDAGASDAGYYEDSLHPSLNPAAVFAITNGGAVDRFSCSSGFGCYQHGYVTGLTARTLVAETQAGLAFTDNSSQLWFAPAAGGAAVQAGGSLFSGPWTNSSGAIFAVVSTPVGDTVHPDLPTPYQLVVYAPASGVLQIGDPMGASPNVVIFPSGEFSWSWNDAANAVGTIRSGLFDGAALHLTTTLSIDPSSYAQAGNLLLARPGVILGALSSPSVVTPDAGTLSGESELIIANPGAGTETLPIQTASAQAGPLMFGGVEGRDGQLYNWAISDDQLKALAVTEDTLTAADGTVTNPYTLWLIDLVAGTANVVSSTVNLLPFAAPTTSPCGSGSVLSPTIAPHFVHSAAGAVNTVQGGTPAASIAAVPAIVFEEILDAPAGGTSSIPVRLHAAKYAQTGAPSAVATVDRYAVLTVGSNTTGACVVTAAPNLGVGSSTNPILTSVPYEAETATGGGAFIFIGAGAGGDTSLFTAPLFASSGTTLTSTQLLDSAVDFRTREDTGRLLALRSDGNLYAGSLGPQPSLTLMLTGGTGGTPALGTSGQGTFGFTPDGAHAYLAVQSGGQAEDWNGGNLVNSVLEEVDLTSGARSDFGQLTYGQGNLLLPALFLDDGATAFGVSAPALGSVEFNATLDLWGAMAPNGTRHFDSGVPFLINDGSSSDAYQFISWRILEDTEQSLDGTEGRIMLGADDYPNIDGYAIGPSGPGAAGGPGALSSPGALSGWHTMGAPTGGSGNPIDPSAPEPTIFVAQDGTLYGGSLFSDQLYITQFFAAPATYSPFGGPYTPDFEVYGSASTTQLTPSDRGSHTDGNPVSSNNLEAVLFKRWGSSSGPHLPLLLATGGTVSNGEVAPDQSLVIPLIRSTDGKFAPTMVTMPPHLPPLPVLP